MKEVISTCIYCGCGCKLIYHVENNKIVKISGFAKDEISEGTPCIKGLTINEVSNKNRIKEPYIREGKKLIKVSLKKAIDKIYEKIKNADPGDIFLNGSGKITNEDNLLIYKIGRHLFWSNFNIKEIPQPKDDIGTMDCKYGNKAHKRKLEDRNAVNSELGKHILDTAIKVINNENVEQIELF